MLNKLLRICLSCVLLAAPRIYAAASSGQMLVAPASAKREDIKFLIARVQLVQSESAPVGEFSLADIVGGTPLVDAHAQAPSWFWQSFGIAIGLSTASAAGGLYFKYTPEQVAKLTTCVSLGDIAYGLGAHLYRFVGYNTSLLSTAIDHSPGLKADVQEEAHELRASRADQMWQLVNKLRQAKERGLIGPEEAAYNNKQLPAALVKILTDTDEQYLKDLIDGVASNVQRRNRDSMFGYVAGGVAGLFFAQCLKGLAHTK